MNAGDNIEFQAHQIEGKKVKGIFLREDNTFITIELTQQIQHYFNKTPFQIGQEIVVKKSHIIGEIKVV